MSNITFKEIEKPRQPCGPNGYTLQKLRVSKEINPRDWAAIKKDVAPFLAAKGKKMTDVIGTGERNVIEVWYKELLSNKR